MILVFAIILANIAVSVIGFRALQSAATAERFLFAPYEVVRGRNLTGMALSNFAHGGWGHLFFNMLSFFFFAPSVVRGGGMEALALVYVISLVGADAIVLFLRSQNPAYRALGASGAVSGVIFAAIVYNPHLDVFIFFIPIGIPGPIFAILYVALSIYLARQEGGTIGHDAHAGGAVAGFIAGAIMAPRGLAPLIERLTGML